MKKITGLLLVLLFTTTVFGQLGGACICEFENKPFTERHQDPHNRDVRFSFEADGKTYMLSYDVNDYSYKGFSRSPERIDKRYVYLHRLDNDGWKIASGIVKTDFYNYDNYTYDYHFDTRYDLTELIGDSTQATVKVYDDGTVKMKFLSFYGEYEYDRRWKYRWHDVLFIPNGDETYKVLKND